MSRRADLIRRAFLEKHEYADVLVFDRDTGLPIEAKYFSGFETQKMKDEGLRVFFDTVQYYKLEEPE